MCCGETTAWITDGASIPATINALRVIRSLATGSDAYVRCSFVSRGYPTRRAAGQARPSSSWVAQGTLILMLPRSVIWFATITLFVRVVVSPTPKLASSASTAMV